MEKQKLFIGNLNFEATEEDIRQLLSAYGTIKNIRMKQKQGIAFVEMSTPEEAAAIIQQLDQQEFKERPLRISPELTKKKAKAVARGRIKSALQQKAMEKES